jgi:hypothetical protein
MEIYAFIMSSKSCFLWLVLREILNLIELYHLRANSVYQIKISPLKTVSSLDELKLQIFAIFALKK